jgi:hypothetical protein
MQGVCANEGDAVENRMSVLRPAKPASSRLLWAGISWIGTTQLFIGQFIAQMAVPGYSMIEDDISYLAARRCGPFTDPISGELIELCSPLHGVMSGSLVATGLLIAIGAPLSVPAWPRLKRTTLGLWMIAASGAGAVISGLFSVDTNAALHGIGALLYFVLASIGISLLGSAMRMQRPGYAAYSVATGVISLFAFLLFGAGMDFGMGRGTIERIAGYTSNIWFIASGALLIASVRPRGRRRDEANRTSA